MPPTKRSSKQNPGRARPATYGGALRMLRLLNGLHERPYGWSFDKICEELGISERTLLRYIAACRKQLTNQRGEPLIEVIRSDDRKLVRLRDDARPVEANVYEALFLYFSLAVFQFLEGTIIRHGVEGLWERFARTLPRQQAARLQDFTRKFFVVPYATKDYRDHDDKLDVIVQALVDQRRLRVDYAGLLGDGKVHEFDPYTLAMYRGGLYLIGRSHRGKHIVKLAVERIRAIEKLAEHFDYPPDYSPEKHTEGVFGIIEGEERKVEIVVHGAETEAYLRSRRIHPTQQLRHRRDGTVVLTMTVRGTEELRNWILGFGPYLEVVKPKALRDEVAASLREAAARYD